MSPTRSASARPRLHRSQRGVMLLEALIAILIFSIGILGIVGLQATAVQQSTDARYRAQAAQLVEQLLGRMWTGDHTLANLQNQYNTCTTQASCPGYYAWFQQVQAALPGVSTTANMPTVSVSSAGGALNGIVTVSVFWRLPSDDPTAPAHHYDSESQIGQ